MGGAASGGTTAGPFVRLAGGPSCCAGSWCAWRAAGVRVGEAKHPGPMATTMDGHESTDFLRQLQDESREQQDLFRLAQAGQQDDDQAVEGPDDDQFYDFQGE